MPRGAPGQMGAPGMRLVFFHVFPCVANDSLRDWSVCVAHLGLCDCSVCLVQTTVPRSNCVCGCSTDSSCVCVAHLGLRDCSEWSVQSATVELIGLQCLRANCSRLHSAMSPSPSRCNISSQLTRLRKRGAVGVGVGGATLRLAASERRLCVSWNML